MNAEPKPCRRLGPRRTAALALLLAALLGGCFSRKAPREDRAKAGPPVVELKTELRTPPEPVAESDADAFQQLLAAATGAGTAKAGRVDDPAWLAAISPRPDWGDQRAGDAANPWRNWELHFTRGTAKEKYASQLDFFGIELAVVLPENKLLYVGKFSQKKPQTRIGPADQEHRCYLTWREGDLSRADGELLTRAGISSEDRVVLKILPPKVEAALAALEKAAAGNNLDGVRKTRFGIRPAGDGYEFYVVEQLRKEHSAP